MVEVRAWDSDRWWEDFDVPVPDTPNDVSVGEIYRLLNRLEAHVNSIDMRLESKVVTMDVYQVAHTNLTGKVLDLEKEIDHHRVEHTRVTDSMVMRRNVILGAAITAGVGFLMGTASIILAAVHG